MINQLAETLLEFPSKSQIQRLRTYIKQTWKTLYRSHEHILEAARDDKLDHELGTPWIVYISPRENQVEIEQALQKAVPQSEWHQIELRVLPSEVDQIKEHGLLYLPYPYVVPGGRFNEMYGWDSYFIQLGLLRDGEVDLVPGGRG